MQRQPDSNVHHLDFMNFQQNDGRLLFMLLTQRPNTVFFQDQKAYTIIIDDKPHDVYLSMAVNKKMREPKPGKNEGPPIQPGDFDYEILDAKLGEGDMGFFFSSMGTIKFDKTQQLASIKLKKNRGVKFTLAQDKTHSPLRLKINPDTSLLAVDHAFNMMQLAKDIYKPKQYLQDAETGYYLFPIKRFEGVNFFNYIKSDETFKALTLTDRLIICRSMTSFLQSLHQRNLIHRDIKPENMLFKQKTLQIFIIDPDLGKDKRISTENGDTAGSPGYVAPETWTQRDATEATDIFSLGRTFMFLLGNIPAVCRYYNAASLQDYVMIAHSGKIPAFRDLFSLPLCYYTNTSAKRLIYSLLEQTQAVDPNRRPTTQQCLAQLDAIHYAHLGTVSTAQASSHVTLFSSSHPATAAAVTNTTTSTTCKPH